MIDSLCKWCVVAAGIAMAGTGIVQAQTFTYSTFNVPEAAPATVGSLSVNGINKAGDISGSFVDTLGDSKAWVRGTKGGIAVLVDPLDTTTPTYTAGYGINGFGAIVGIFFDTATNSYPGFVYSTTKKTFTTFTPAGQPAGSAVYLEGINNKTADYCGSVGAPPNFVYQAFLSIGGTTTIVPLPANTGSGCTALNDGNVAVGYYTDSAGVIHGWIRNPKTGVVTTYNAPGASTVVASSTCWGNVAGTVLLGINDSEEISGHFWDTSNNSHGFVLSKGKFIKLDVPGAFQTGGGGINSLGEVVGHYSDSSCNNSGFIATPH